MANQLGAQQQRRRPPGPARDRFDETDEFEREPGRRIDERAAARERDHHEEEEDEDDDDEEADPVDRIRRSFHHPHHPHHQHHLHLQQEAAARQPSRKPETIQVNLDEGYFARERKLVLESLANARQKLSSLQLLNPAANRPPKQAQQSDWSEKEKYTLDSLNEFKGPLDERFQWNKPDDGREVWPSKLQYFMAITSYSIGLGNVIRFPILVQKNGGLAFIIPFVIMLLLEGIPLFYLELAIGQRTRKAAISCWNLVSPFAAGIGLASAAVSFLIGLYYNTMVAWTLLYTWDALTGGGPRPADAACEGAEPPSPPSPSPNGTQPQPGPALAECQLASPFELHWYRTALNVSTGASDWSHFNWPVAVCLALAWLISYLCLVRGLSTSKRLVYAVSSLPYVILLIFLAKSLSLPGMSHGLAYLFAPQWPKLFDPYVWLQAAAQVFFSLGLGFGGLIALSSYNPVNNNCYRDAIRVSLVNFGTSLLAGVMVFSILGFRANLQHGRCQADREQQIDFYLADYNLKVLEHGALFKQTTRKQAAADARANLGPIEEFMAVRRDAGGGGDTGPGQSKVRPPGGASSAAAAAANVAADDDEQLNFGLDDAIDSIANLDRQLDLGSASGSFDYGDSDTEFILNASTLIDRAELDQVIERIENLPSCSVRRELDESTRGTGLVFVMLAEAISEFGANSHAWSLLFFLMILSLGFDSQFGNLEGLLSSLTDLNFSLNETRERRHGRSEGVAGGDGGDGGGIDDYDESNNYAAHHLANGAGALEPPAAGPAGDRSARAWSRASRLLANQQIRAWATGLICCLSLALSLVIFAHGAGSYMFAIFDEYASSFSLVLIALFELLAISYIYGLKTFCTDCELMTGKRPPFLVLLSWRYISPIVLLLLVLATVKQFALELNYEVWNPVARELGDDSAGWLAADWASGAALNSHLEIKQWPTWCVVFGAGLIVSCVAWIPLVAVLRVLRVNLVPEEQHRRWFPVEELREFHQLQDQERRVTKLERVLFGFKQDDD